MVASFSFLAWLCPYLEQMVAWSLHFALLSSICKSKVEIVQINLDQILAKNIKPIQISKVDSGISLAQLESKPIHSLQSNLIWATYSHGSRIFHRKEQLMAERMARSWPQRRPRMLRSLSERIWREPRLEFWALVDGLRRKKLLRGWMVRDQDEVEGLSLKPTSSFFGSFSTSI